MMAMEVTQVMSGYMSGKYHHGFSLGLILTVKQHMMNPVMVYPCLQMEKELPLVRSSMMVMELIQAMSGYMSGMGHHGFSLAQILMENQQVII
mmetsp:Transcript_31436/g.65963  ORF Transcript_31436/g.65963 Transcript_31436/m.65963 type:complete len:93 (+) Transcript_31436:141-419(+)